MRLHLCCLAVMAGVIVALPSNDFAGDIEVVRRATPLKALTSKSANSAAAGALVSAVESSAGTIKNAVENTDKEKVLEAFYQATTKGADLTPLIRDKVLPVVISTLEMLPNMTGQDALDLFSQFNGQQVLDLANAVNVKKLLETYDSLKVGDFLKVALGINFAPIVNQVKALQGNTLLEIFNALTSTQVAELAASLVNATNLTPLLEKVGIDDIKPLLIGILPKTGSEITAVISTLNGATILKDFGTLTGPNVMKSINEFANGFLTNVRQLTATAVKKPVNVNFTTFDTEKIIKTVQDFIQELVGVTVPSVVAEINNWTGAKQLELIKQLNFDKVVNATVAAAKLVAAGAAQVAKAGGIVPKSGYISGQDLLKDIQSFNPVPVAKHITDSGIITVVKDFTGIDITPHVAALAKFKPTVFLKNLQKMKGSRLVKLIDDLGVTEYLRPFQGFNVQSLRNLVNVMSGKLIITFIKKMKFAVPK